MISGIFNLDEVKSLIAAGKSLLIAADESLLDQLPNGKWIAGSTPYFVAESGGIETSSHLFVSELPSFVTNVEITEYTVDSISQIYNNTPQNGFTAVIIPASSQIHTSFALNAPQYENFALNPLIGWIAGVRLSDIGTIFPTVYWGAATKKSTNTAVAMHVSLPNSHLAELNIINIFKQGSGDIITFPISGFETSKAMVNGKSVDFAQYINQNQLDTRLPLVADYAGAEINISFQSVSKEQNMVKFYAPIFNDVEYKLAAPINNYAQTFAEMVKTLDNNDVYFSCNCILNYVYGELNGKKTGNFIGPITFGEIAYQLLNQTLCYLTIKNIT